MDAIEHVMLKLCVFHNVQETPLPETCFFLFTGHNSNDVR